MKELKLCSNITQEVRWFGRASWKPALVSLLGQGDIFGVLNLKSRKQIVSNRKVHGHCHRKMCYTTKKTPSLMRIPAHGIRVLWLQWANSHGLQKSCGEKGMGWPLSEWERAKRAREPCPMSEQAFIAFLDTLHGGWSSFTMDRLAVGDYLLQITKERMLLITSKRRML